MQRQLTLRAAVALVMALTTLVATLALAFVVQGVLAPPDTGQTAPASLLGAAVYAPFALVAVFLPALAVPIARAVLAAAPGLRHPDSGEKPWSPAVDAILLWGIAEILVALVLALGGPGPSTPLAMHLLLAVYAVVAAWQLNRRPDHDDTLSPPEPS